MGKTMKTRSSSRKLVIGRTCKCELYDDLLAAGENKMYHLHRKSLHDYSNQCMNWLIQKNICCQSQCIFARFV